MTESNQIEQRRSRRVRMAQALRVCPLDAKDGSFEEVGSTKDLSQGGVYFETKRPGYFVGMRLSVMVPFDATLRNRNYEYHGLVTRVEDLGDGKKGVAVKFVKLGGKKA